MKVEVFLLQLGHSKEEEGLRGVVSFTKAGWKLWRSGNILRLTHSRPHGKANFLLGKDHPLRLRTFYKLNREGWSFYAFSTDAARKTNLLAV